MRLIVLDSPYRVLIELLLAPIMQIIAVHQPNETLTIVVPQFVPKHWWANALRTQTALTLRVALVFKRGIVITDEPYQIE